jgi:hypothetical protein
LYSDKNEAELPNVLEVDRTNTKEYVADRGPAATQVFVAEEQSEEFMEHCGAASSGDDDAQVDANEKDKALYEELMQMPIGRKIARMYWPMLGKAVSEYKTPHFFTLAFPWLFPGGRGDFFYRDRMYEISFQEWASNLIYYRDGRFQKDESWSFITLNMSHHRKNVSQSNFFVTTPQLCPDKPFSLQELKEKMRDKDQGQKFVKNLVYYTKSICGSTLYWHDMKEKVMNWINFHIESGNGPPTLFITLSCAEYFWGDLMKLLVDRFKMDNPGKEIPDIKNDITARVKLANDYMLDVQDFFQQRTKHFLEEVFGKTIGIKYYFAR